MNIIHFTHTLTVTIHYLTGFSPFSKGATPAIPFTPFISSSSAPRPNSRRLRRNKSLSVLSFRDWSRIMPGPGFPGGNLPRLDMAAIGWNVVLTLPNSQSWNVLLKLSKVSILYQNFQSITVGILYLTFQSVNILLKLPKYVMQVYFPLFTWSSI